MPRDTATQHMLGLFRGLPAWWKKRQAELAARVVPLSSQDGDDDGSDHGNGGGGGGGMEGNRGNRDEGGLGGSGNRVLGTPWRREGRSVPEQGFVFGRGREGARERMGYDGAGAEVGEGREMARGRRPTGGAFAPSPFTSVGLQGRGVAESVPEGPARFGGNDGARWPWEQQQQQQQHHRSQGRSGSGTGTGASGFGSAACRFG